MHAPEEVEATQPACDAIGATSGAGHSGQEDGQHQEGEDDAGQGCTAVLKIQDLLQQGHAARLLLGTELPELQRVKLDCGRRLDEVDVHAVAADVDGGAKHGVAGNHDVECNGIIDGNPLARRTHATHSRLQAFQGWQDQHGEVQVHAVAPALGDGICPGLVEASSQVGQKADHEDQDIQHGIHEGREPLLANAAAAEATVHGLEPSTNS